jgi:uncharacterized membrane protein YoaK (UPF0700 family)
MSEAVDIESRQPRITQPVALTLLALTFVTGIVDALSFLGLGQVFAGMMTGNVLFLGFGIAGASGSSVVAPLVAIVAFGAGGLAGGFLAARSPDHPGWGLIACLAFEVVMVGAAAVLAAAIDVNQDELSAWVLIAALSLAMGARNTAVRRIGLAELPTNVLTVAVASFEAGTSFAGASPSHLVPRAASVLAMLGGAIAGALLLEGPGLSASLAFAAIFTGLAGSAYTIVVRRAGTRVSL